MNFSAIKSELYRRLNLPTAPASSEVTRLASFINLTHRQILSIPGMDGLRDGTITFASVASQAVYGLPSAVQRIEAITDRTTQRKLRPVALDDVLSGDPALVQTGPSDCYINRGWQAVATQPSAAAQIFYKSSSAADTTQEIFFEGIRSGGATYSTALAGGGFTLNGTTALGLVPTDIVEITKFYIDAETTGDVILTQGSGVGTELARLKGGNGTEQIHSRYLGIQLYPTPASAITYYVDYVRNVMDMSNATDEPLLPEDFHWLLVEGALVKEWTKRDDVRRQEAEADLKRGISALKYFMHNQSDDLPVAGGLRREINRYGAWYPATRY